MKREIFDCVAGFDITGCCPGHDKFPADTYSNRRSKHARSRDKKREHQFVRTLKKRQLTKEIENYEATE